MKNRNIFKILIGVVCVLLLALVVFVAMIFDSRSPNPIFGVFNDNNEEVTTAPAGETKDPTLSTDRSEQTTDTPNADISEGQVTKPNELPPVVEIVPEKDPETGKEIDITFPCKVEGYGLVIEKLAPYTGMFVEDGTNVNKENIAMLLVHNDGDYPVEYTQLRVMYGQEEFLFDISALPVGAKMVVQEKNAKSMPKETKVESVNALVVQRAKMEMSEKSVSVTDNGDNTLTVKNLTDKTIPTVRVFYKYYMEDEEIFVGGIAFTARISRLGAGASVTIQPSHYTSQAGRVVMVLTYASEV